MSTDQAIRLLEVLAWPLAVLGAVLALTSRPGTRALGAIFGGMRRFRGFGFELELEPGPASRLRVTLEEQFDEYRRQVQGEFDRWARRYDVGRRLATVAEELIVPELNGAVRFHATVYVEDILLENALYRLVDYYPEGGGRGSTYNVRFGIIGKAWRLRETWYADKVHNTREELIMDWGMTSAEALSAGRDTKSFLAMTLEEEGLLEGLLFVEADGEEAFGPEDSFDNRFGTRLANSQEIADLTHATASAMREIRGRGPELSVFSR